MFTGLVEQIGRVASVDSSSCGMSLTIACSPFHEPIDHGDSMSISGCCLTVTQSEENDEELLLAFDVIQESLRCTTINTLRIGDFVNLERSLRAGAFLGGHFVQGHVDTTSKVKKIYIVGKSWFINFELPTKYRKFIVENNDVHMTSWFGHGI